MQAIPQNTPILSEKQAWAAPSVVPLSIQEETQNAASASSDGTQGAS